MAKMMTATRSQRTIRAATNEEKSKRKSRKCQAKINCCLKNVMQLRGENVGTKPRREQAVSRDSSGIPENSSRNFLG